MTIHSKEEAVVSRVHMIDKSTIEEVLGSYPPNTSIVPFGRIIEAWPVIPGGPLVVGSWVKDGTAGSKA
jgi:hypothetical protein